MFSFPLPLEVATIIILIILLELCIICAFPEAMLPAVKPSPTKNGHEILYMHNSHRMLCTWRRERLWQVCPSVDSVELKKVWNSPWAWTKSWTFTADFTKQHVSQPSAHTPVKVQDNGSCHVVRNGKRSVAQSDLRTKGTNTSSLRKVVPFFFFVWLS